MFKHKKSAAIKKGLEKNKVFKTAPPRIVAPGQTRSNFCANFF
jgi:hypothetical protein